MDTKKELNVIFDFAHKSQFGNNLKDVDAFILLENFYEYY